MMTKTATFEEVHRNNYLRNTAIVAVRDYISKHAARLREEGNILHFSAVRHVQYRRKILYMEQFGEAGIAAIESWENGIRTESFAIIVPVAAVYAGDKEQHFGVDRKVKQRRFTEEELVRVWRHVNAALRKLNT